MSEQDPNTNPTPAADAAPPNQQPPAPQDDPTAAADPTDDPAAARLSREAKRYRLERNEAREENARLIAQVDGLQRAEVERLAADRLQDPADLWLSADIKTMRGEDGSLDLERVKTEVDRIVSEKPHWRKPVDPNPLHQGAGHEPAIEPQRPSFGASLRRAGRG